MRIQPGANASLLILVCACAHASRFESTRWHDLLAPDNGVALSAPADYHPRDTSGCWTRHIERRGRPGWRDLCVEAIDSTGWYYSFTSPENAKCIADCVTIEELRVDTVMLAGRRTIIERARVSGGMYSSDRTQELLVRVYNANGTVLKLDGETGDEEGYDELIAIAATMRELPRKPRTQAKDDTTR